MSTTTTPGTPGWLRARNDRVALALLLEHGPLTRNRIGELSGLSKPTAAQMVARLESAGLISVVGEASNGRGPNAVLYGVRDDRMRGVAIDISANATTSTVVDASGRRIRPSKPFSPRTIAHPKATCAGHFMLQRHGAGIDPCQRENRLRRRAGRDGGWRRAPLLHRHPPRLARNRAHATGSSSPRASTCYLDNDVNLAAVAERAVGAARDAASFALLWMGDGLGVSVDLGGSVHRGASGGAGEIGYLPVPREAAAIDPDANDLTDLIGGDAVAAIARRTAPAATIWRACSTASATTALRSKSWRPGSPRRDPRARRARPRCRRARRSDRFRRRCRTCPARRSTAADPRAGDHPGCRPASPSIRSARRPDLLLGEIRRARLAAT